MTDYSDMTTDDFDQYLEKVLENVTASPLLQVPGVYELVTEHYNNDVLDLWAEDQEDK